MEKLDSIKMIIKWLLFSYIIAFSLILIYSVLLAYTSLPESTIPSFTVMIGIISVFVSSSILAIKNKKNGLKIGAINGLLYVLGLYIICLIGGNLVSFSINSIFSILIYIFFGMLGGIIGVNFSNK